LSKVPRRVAVSAAVVLAQVALLAVLYPSPARSGFVADPWVYLEQLRGGLWPMLFHPIGYHWQPVAYAFIALVRAVWGENAGAFQWVNLAQLLSIGFLTYALGRRVTGDAGIGFVGSVLYLGSAAFYEASYWPLAGNMHLLAAQLYLVTLVVAWDVGTGRWPRVGPWLLGAGALAAVLAHPAMATVVPVAGLTLWLVSRERGTLSGRSRWIALGALAVVAAAALGQRAIAKALSTATVPPPGFDRERCYRIAMAIADMAVLRGSADLGHGLVGLGGGFDSLRMSWGIALWILVPLAVLAYGCRAARTPGFRVLAAFYVLHVFGVGVAAGLPSRQTSLAQVPVALLVAWGLAALASRLEHLLASPDGALVVRQLPIVAALLLVIGAVRDHRLAARLTHQAADTTRALSREVAAAVPPDGAPRAVVLVNAPLLLWERGIGTPVLRDGAGQIPRLASPAVTSVELRHVALPRTLPHLTDGLPMSPSELRARVVDPGAVVLVFEPPPRLVRRLLRGNVERAIEGR
jgi:hypothetical protein